MARGAAAVAAAAVVAVDGGVGDAAAVGDGGGGDVDGAVGAGCTRHPLCHRHHRRPAGIGRGDRRPTVADSTGTRPT